MSTKQYYAKHWTCGYGATHANTGENYVEIDVYDSKAERDQACFEYTVPNYCPTAKLEAVKASDPDVRRYLRELEKDWLSGI